MYTTEDLFQPNVSGVDVRPRQNLDIHEDLFLYEYARYMLHKRLVKEGLLSPYAVPFYPPTEIENRKTEIYQNNQHVKEQSNKSTNVSKIQVKEESVKYYTCEKNTTEKSEIIQEENKAGDINTEKATKDIVDSKATC